MMKKQDSGQPEPGSLDAPPAPARMRRRPPGETAAGASRNAAAAPEPKTAEGTDPALTKGRTFVRKVRRRNS